MSKKLIIINRFNYHVDQKEYKNIQDEYMLKHV